MDSDALASLLARVSFYPLPPDGFDPSTTNDAVLAHYGLPIPAGNGPAVALFYKTFLQRRSDGVLAFVQLEGQSTVDDPIRVTPLSAPWPAQKSVNWSGGYVTPRGGGSLMSVMGTWTVPAVSEPAGPPYAEYHSSTWIGLDGQRRYPDSTLPQMGTRQRWIRGAARPDTYDAWYQWWDRGQPIGPIPLPTFPVKAGDTISAILTVLNSTTVRFNLKNVTQSSISQTFDVSAPAGRTVTGATAEWIMERPSPIPLDGWGAYPLPAYAPFAFTDCLAQTRMPGGSNLLDVNLDTARTIRMYEIASNPCCVRTLSIARRILSQNQKLEIVYAA